MWEIASPAFLPVQLLLFFAIVLAPGALLAAVALSGQRVHGAAFGAVSLVLGLVVVPLSAFVLVALTGHPLSLFVLMGPAGLVCVACAPLVWRGRRPAAIHVDRWLWLALLGVAVVVLVTHNPSLLLTTLFHWASNAEGNCFRQGTLQYLGVPSSALMTPMPPVGVAWDGVMRGNIALSSLFVFCFGLPGFRYLRVVTALLLGLTGYLLGEEFTGRRSGAFVGLIVFALNPYVVMVQETDRNLLALAFVSFLFAAQSLRLLPFWVIGVLAGFTTGLGLQLLPAVYLIPLALYYPLAERRTWWRGLGVLVVGGAISLLWLVGIGWYRPLVAEEVYTYDLGLFVLESNYALGFPFASSISRVIDGQYPAALTYALHVVDTLGAAVMATAIVGWLAVFFRRRREHYLLLLFGLPIFLALALMTSIVEDQLRLIIGALLPLLVFVAVGIDWLVFGRAGWQVRGGAFLVALVVLSSLATVAGHARFPESSAGAPLSDSDGALALLEGDPILPYLSPDAIARRTSGKISPPNLNNLVSRCDADPRLKCRDYRFPRILPDFGSPHPPARKANVIHGRLLDFTMANATAYSSKESWRGLISEALWANW
jgi:hypothetical protein